MEYRLKRLEHSSLKGRIGEQLARAFIRNELAARLLEEENWTHVLLSKNEYKYHSWTWNTKLFEFDNFREDFTSIGFSASSKLLSKYATVAGILMQNHCTPDGLLLKLRETGKRAALSRSSWHSRFKAKALSTGKNRRRLRLPIVEGELEVVEIKCGRNAKLMDKQKETYNALIAKGVPLRMIRVRIVSFDLNQFLVEERKFEQFLK